MQAVCSEDIGQLKTQKTYLHPILRRVLPHDCVLLSQSCRSKERCYPAVDNLNGMVEAQDLAEPRLSVGGQDTIPAMKLASCHIRGGVPLTSPHFPDGLARQRRNIIL